MKNFIAVLFACSLGLVACDKKQPKPVVADSTLSEHPGSIAQSAADKTSQKINEWKLSPSDVKAELEGTGRVVREKTAAAGQQFGEATDNERLVTVINSKLVADPELSGLKINVEVDRGVATLKGAVKSVELISRATALALETQGIRQVISLLALDPNPK